MTDFGDMTIGEFARWVADNNSAPFRSTELQQLVDERLNDNKESK